MESILNELQKKKCWKSTLKTQCRRNSIDPSYASTFTIVKIRKFFQNPPQVQSASKQRQKSSVWLENELKAYQWLLICLSTIKGSLIKDFGREQWSQLSNIFQKEENILEYESIKLIREKEGVKRRWDEEESEILFGILKQEPDSNKWNEIARTLFIESGKRYYRSGKQCRERWFNHLDPHKKRGEWQTTEDRFIAEYILEKGKKWSEISRHLKNQRTEHMIKNRFKTLMIKLKKRLPHVKNEDQLLRQFIKEPIVPPERIHPEPIIPEVREKQEKRQRVNRTSVFNIQKDSNPLGFQFEIKEQQILERINHSNFKEFEFQQVVTPCPVIYQNFTPTFLNTPHALPFLCSFGKFDQNDNLFLKNS